MIWTLRWPVCYHSASSPAGAPMSGRQPTFVRLSTALAVCALASAIQVGLAQNPPTLDPGRPGTSPIAPEASTPQPVEATTNADTRLRAVEEQVQRLLDVDEGRVATPAPRPSFQMGGQVQMDYIYI